MTARQRVHSGYHSLSSGARTGVFVGDAMEKTNGQLSGRDRSRVAVQAFASERTVKRYLDGEKVSESTRLRIEGALRKLGLAGAVRAEVAS